MRCTSKKIYRKRRNRRIKLFLLAVFFVLLLLIGGAYWISVQPDLIEYETLKYGKTIAQHTLYVDDLCVATDDIVSERFQTDDEFHAVGLFQLDEKNVIHAEKIHEKIYPASTTKIMTIYLALKYGTLTDTITISKNAVDVPLDSSRAGFKVGDQLTLESLLYSLMLPSGNDSAVAVAEYLAESEEAFAKMMNTEAKKIGATNSNFVSPHGYQDEDHYTTAYDLYLIFNECIKYEKFLEIVSTAEYKTNIQQATGTQREMVWKQSNQFVNGLRKVPEGIAVIGGKTGTTNEAGSCLILYSNISENPYISIIMGADTKPILYKNMSNLLMSVTN